MIKGKLSDIASVTGGELIGEDAPFSGVFIDSREPVPGAVFWGIKGEHFDGETFAADALEAGAGREGSTPSGVVVSKREHIPADRSGVVVKDTLDALARLASIYRYSLSGKLIAVTGSFGKTTAKDVLALLLGEGTYAAPASFNNRIGIPLTLLNAPEDAPFVVAEVGVNRRGEMAALAEILQPDAVLFTGIGPVHLEGFIDEEGAAEEKGIITLYVRRGGIVMLPAGLSGPIKEKLTPNKTPFIEVHELAPGAVAVGEGGVGEDGLTVLQAGVGEAKLSVCPVGQVDTLDLAWRAAELLAGLTEKTLLKRLKGFQPTPGRWDVIQLADGRIILVDDSFNANPVSMSAALDGLSMMPADEKVAVLGDMRELGAGAGKMHVEIGRKAAECGVSTLFLVGEMADKYREGYGASEAFSTAGDAAGAVVSCLRGMRARTAVLVKGSHSVGLETVVDAVREAL